MPVELPHSLEAVEDWGFAHMKNLREIALPAKMLTFGKQVFLGCDRLERVRLFGADLSRYFLFFGIHVPFFSGADLGKFGAGRRCAGIVAMACKV